MIPSSLGRCGGTEGETRKSLCPQSLGQWHVVNLCFPPLFLRMPRHLMLEFHELHVNVIRLLYVAPSARFPFFLSALFFAGPSEDSLGK